MIHYTAVNNCYLIIIRPEMDIKYFESVLNWKTCKFTIKIKKTEILGFWNNMCLQFKLFTDTDKFNTVVNSKLKIIIRSNRKTSSAIKQAKEHTQGTAA